MIQGIYVWVQVVIDKYISHNTMEEWVINPLKQLNNVSIIWKVVTNSFHLVCDWLIWKIGKGDKMKIGLNPWVGSRDIHKIPLQMIQELRNKGCYNLQ